MINIPTTTSDEAHWKSGAISWPALHLRQLARHSQRVVQMSKASLHSENTSPKIPKEFGLCKYDLEDDFSIWKAALARRVVLRHEVDELLNWRALVGELSAQRKSLYGDWLLEIQNKVLALIKEPILASSDDIGLPVGSKLLSYESFFQHHQAISDRFYADEAKSASKLKDKFYIDIFDLEQAEIAKKSHGDPRSRFIESYKMWRADIQMPDFSGQIGIKVNLLYDDDFLCKEFRKWLKATRAQANPQFSTHKVVKQNVLAEWKRMQILPCIDLRLYLDAFGVSLDWREIGISLYGNPDENHDKVWGDVAARAKDADFRGRDLIHPFSFQLLRYEEEKARK